MSSNIGLVDRQCKRTCDRCCIFDQKIAVEKLTGLSLLAEKLQPQIATPGGGEETNSDDLDDGTPCLSSSSHKERIYFRNKCGEIVGIQRCILFTRKSLPVSLDDLLSRVSRMRQSRRWAVLLYSGGKFAGGIFDGLNEVVHKAMNHYTVRAKQGGSQSSHDANAGGMGGPKSAGANLRRHGEIAIRNDISNLLHNRWRSQLQACQYIFLWSPKVHRNIFFNPPASDSSRIIVEEEAEDAKPRTVLPQTTTVPLTPDPNATAACAAKLGMLPDDSRVRRVPCRTKHISYMKVKELHRELASFVVYDEHANLEFLSQSGRKQLRTLSENGQDTLMATKSGRLIYGPLSLMSPKQASTESASSATDVSNADAPFTEAAAEVGEVDGEYYDSESWDDEEETPEASICSDGTDTELAATTTNLLINSNDPEVVHEDASPVGMNTNDLYAVYQTWHRRLRVAVVSGDHAVARSLLPEVLLFPGQDTVPQTEIPSDWTAPGDGFAPSSPGQNSAQMPTGEQYIRLLNFPLSEGRTLLHVAVEFQSDPNLLLLLLQSGCDPTLCDAEGTSAYTLAKLVHKKALANVFRRFRFFNPDAYDYDKAQIPPPLDPSKEAAKADRDRERLRKQRQRTRERKAVERSEQEKKQEEELEKKRFQALPDREKRALAAERRLLATKSSATNAPCSLVISRCFECARDITGKIPFTYLDNNFCTPACLRVHRLASSKGKPSTGHR